MHHSFRHSLHLKHSPDVLFTQYNSYSSSPPIVAMVEHFAAISDVPGLAPPPTLHFVSCTHSMSTFLFTIISANSLPLPVIVPTFRVPTFTSIFRPILLFCLSLTCFPPLFLLRPTVAYFPTAPCWTTVSLAVFVNPSPDRSSIIITFLFRI